VGERRRAKHCLVDDAEDGVAPIPIPRMRIIRTAFDVQSNVADTSLNHFYGLARLATSVGRGSEQRLADAIADRLQQESPLARTWGLRILHKKVAYVNETTRTALFVLLGAVGFVLLITCANTANLYLSQVVVRQREMAIRTAIGASRWRLIREMMAESVLLAACGGAVGLLIATWGVDAIVAAAPANLTFQATSPIEIDARILLVTAAMTVLTGLVFGLLPALRGSRPHLDLILKGTTGSGGSASYSRFAGALIVAEVAFSLILLVGAALMIRTLANLQALQPGFEPDGLIALEISLPTDKYASSAAREAFIDALRERLLAIPGVAQFAFADGVPPSGGSLSFGTPEAEGGTASAPGQQLTIPGNTVSRDYFRALRIPLVAGRFFTDADSAESLIVTKALADRYWPDGTAVGRRFRPFDRFPWRTIVGIVGDVDSWATDKPTPFQMYTPWPAPTQGPGAGNAARRRDYRARVILVRADDPAAAIPAIKTAVWSIDKNQPIDRVSLVADVYADTFGRQRFVLELMTAFGAVAVLLTMVGLFGVLSEIVLRKTREIGIRMALGARQSDVLQMVLSRGLALSLAGATLGLIGAFALTRFLGALLFQVSPVDPGSFALMTIVMIATALLACWIPARRAMRVGPADALRAE
jgi:putative ABC transport system permease protein